MEPDLDNIVIGSGSGVYSALLINYSRNCQILRNLNRISCIGWVEELGQWFFCRHIHRDRPTINKWWSVRDTGRPALICNIMRHGRYSIFYVVSNWWPGWSTDNSLLENRYQCCNDGRRTGNQWCQWWQLARQIGCRYTNSKILCLIEPFKIILWIYGLDIFGILGHYWCRSRKFAASAGFNGFWNSFAFSFPNSSYLHVRREFLHLGLWWMHGMTSRPFGMWQISHSTIGRDSMGL